MEAVDESLRSGEVERAEDAQRSAELVRATTTLCFGISTFLRDCGHCSAVQERELGAARAAEAARAEEVASLRAEVGEVLAQSEAAIRTAASQVRAPLCLPGYSRP